MSHFFTIVVLPKNTKNTKDTKDTKDILSQLNKLLAPFNEGKEVKPYMRKCWCVGNEAHTSCQKQIDGEFGDIESARKDFQERHKKLYEEMENHYAKIMAEDKKKDSEKYLEMSENIDSLWEKEIANPRQNRLRELMRAHPKFHSAKENCERCKGAGEYKTTYNPNSQWDWYRVGGRWDGEIKGVDVDSEDGGFNFQENHESFENNVASVDDVIEKRVIPFAIITPDKKWHERGSMGWWGIVAEEKEKKDWKEEVIDILMKYKGHMAVGCDLHI
jgi:hypothetical protein